MNVIQQIKTGITDLFARGFVVLPVAGLALCLGILGFSGSAMASTPDGETPANEGVCDSLHGGTPGLYGLCVAYCEAQDLDTVGDKETPNNKILRNYRRKMRAGDPDMPCIKVPCPCWNDAEFASVVGNINENTACTAGTTDIQVRNFSPFQLAVADPARPSCRFTDTSVTPRISVRFNDDPGDPQFDPSSWQTCYDQIEAACASVP